LLYTDDKKTLREMLHRQVLTKEVWLAAVHGLGYGEPLLWKR
jgi:hypothetical protein